MSCLPNPKATVVLLTLTWTAAAHASEIYQWADDDGVPQFSDTRPEDDVVVITLYVRDTNPPDYDPATDPYSVHNQAERTNATWAELEKAREEREQKRREEAERYARFSLPHDPYDHYLPLAYYSPVYPGRFPRHQRRIIERQVHALETLGLTGPRPNSINSGRHDARVQRSRELPTTFP